MAKLTSQDSGRRNVGSADYLQRFFLERLARMVATRRERAPFLEAGELDLRLLDKAVYSTFCDCLDLGVGEKARAILRGEETTYLSGRSE